MNEKNKEEIQHQRDLKNNLLAAFIVTASGTIGLMFNLVTIINYIFFIAGVIISYVIFISYLDKITGIRTLINSIKEEK